MPQYEIQGDQIRFSCDSHWIVRTIAGVIFIGCIYGLAVMLGGKQNGIDGRIIFLPVGLMAGYFFAWRCQRVIDRAKGVVYHHRGLFLLFCKKEWRLDSFDRLEVWKMPGHRSMGQAHASQELKRPRIYFVYLVSGNQRAVKLFHLTENYPIAKSRTKKVSDFCGVHYDMNDKIHNMKMGKTWNKYSISYPVKE
jgi:hypothetical protein